MRRLDFGFRADRYGYLDRWKTLPQKRNPDTKLEDEIWEHVKHNVYRFPDVELIFWLLFYSRGEIALDVVPTLPGLLARMAFQTVVLDTIYYHFHRWEHSPGVYQRLHKRHHEMKVTNVYGHLVVSCLSDLLKLQGTCRFQLHLPSILHSSSHPLAGLTGRTPLPPTHDRHLGTRRRLHHRPKPPLELRLYPLFHFARSPHPFRVHGSFDSVQLVESAVLSQLPP